MIAASADAAVVGRDSEIFRVVDAVLDPRVDLVLVDGPAGIGKSTLLAEVASRFELDGWIIETARGLSGGHTYPFAPFLHLLDPAEPSDRALDDLHRLLGRLGRPPEGVRLLLVIDDLHLLDEGSLVLAQQLASMGTITVLGSVRGLGMTHEDVVAFATSDRGRLVGLGPLDRDGSDSLVETVLEDPSPELCEQVWRGGRGSPLFARELLRGSIESGSLVRTEKGWQIVGELAASDRLVDLLRRRIEQQSECRQLVLRALALAGSLPPRVVEHLAAPDDVDQLERGGLVRWTTEVGADGRLDGSRLTLSHDLFATVAREDLSPAARAQVSSRLVAAVRDAGTPGPEELMLLAHLLLDLGVEDAPTFVAAADVALRRYDDTDALRLVDAALDSGGGFDAEVVRAAALGRLGRIREAAELFDDLERRAAGTEQVASVAYRYASHLQERGEPERAAEVLDRGIAQLPGQAAAPLTGFLSSLYFMTGRPLEAIEVAEPLVRGEFVPPEALPGLLSSWATLGNPTQVLAISSRTWSEPSRSLDTNMVVLNLVWNRLLALWQVGGLAGIDDPLSGLPRRRVEAFAHSWIAGSMRATFASLRGHLDESLALYQPLEPRLLSTMVQVGVFNLSLLVGIRSALGDVAGAKAMLEVVDAFPPSASMAFQWWVDRARLALVAALGDLDDARSGSRELAQRHAGQEFHVTTSLHDVVRFGGATTVVDALASQAGRPGATWWDLQCHRHALAVADADVGELIAVAEEFETGGLDLVALEAFSQASSLARSNSARYAPTSRARAVVGVTRLGAVCGRVRTPATIANPSGVTARELTVARMAASGMTNAEIAAQLGTSVRTVGNQLQHVFDRLGVHSRHALVEVLGPHD